MTTIADLKEIVTVGDGGVFQSKLDLKIGDILIGQDAEEVKEEWFTVSGIRSNWHFLKTGYTMYILTKHIK